MKKSLTQSNSTRILNNINDSKVHLEIKKTFEIFDKLNEIREHFLTKDDYCTPMQCVKTMVDYIPLEFWKKKNIRILDPCAGNGNFAAYIQFLTKKENIWNNEINEVRFNNLKNLLNPIHARLGDGLDLNEDFAGSWDLIVANPPYSGGSNKNKSLSNKFILNSVDMLNDKGYLCFITPNNWMTYNNNNVVLRTLLNEGSFLIIDNDAKKFFPKVGSSFVVFVWQKGVLNNKTTIYNNYLKKDKIDGVYIPSELNFLPLYISKETISLTLKCLSFKRNRFNYRCDLHNFTQKSKLNDSRQGDFKYETIHTIRKRRFANFKQDIFDKWNIIIPLSTYYKPFIETNINVTQSVGYLSFDSKEEATYMLEKLNLKHIKLMIHLTRYGNFNNIKVLKHLIFDDIHFTNEETKEINELISNIKY